MSNHPIAILGGSFDPIHNGHLTLADSLDKIFRFDHIRFIPCQQPVHKSRQLASGQDRVAMLQLALVNNHNYVLDDREMVRDTPSYMVTTLESLRAEFPQRSLSLVLGLDAFLKLNTWHSYKSLLGLANIIVASRPGAEFHPNEQIKTLLAAHNVDNVAAIVENTAGGIIVQSIPALDISATQIRDRCERGETCEGLLPQTVFAYIKDHQLYQGT